MVKTNDLKKGTPITLRNGWAAIIMDNKKGDIRLAEVDGFAKEIGSIYAHDIDMAFINDEWVMVDYTKSQLALKDMVDNLGQSATLLT
jgi:hypothetical protein